MNWEEVQISSGWLCVSATALLAVLLWDAPVVQVIGGLVLFADLTHLVYSLVQAYERRRDDEPDFD